MGRGDNIQTQCISFFFLFFFLFGSDDGHKNWRFVKKTILFSSIPGPKTFTIPPNIQPMRKYKFFLDIIDTKTVLFSIKNYFQLFPRTQILLPSIPYLYSFQPRIYLSHALRSSISVPLHIHISFIPQAPYSLNPCKFH